MPNGNVCLEQKWKYVAKAKCTNENDILDYSLYGFYCENCVSVTEHEIGPKVFFLSAHIKRCLRIIQSDTDNYSVGWVENTKYYV